MEDLVDVPFMAYWLKKGIHMILIFLLPWLNNLIMSGVKWLFTQGLVDKAKRNMRLRLVLALLSFFGVIAGSALNGTPIEPNAVSSLSTALLEMGGVFLVSHFSFKMIKFS